jgi:hypothetical protein
MVRNPEELTLPSILMTSGCKQRDVSSYNVFHPLSYEGAVGSLSNLYVQPIGLTILRGF